VSGHTLGPWRLDHSDAVDLRNHVGISSESHSLLAQIVWKMDDDERSPSCEANAHLISAAPDLLEALQAIIKSLADQDDEGMIEHVQPMIDARAAIAKATGVQS
jgi:hypothetical protein